MKSYVGTDPIGVAVDEISTPFDRIAFNQYAPVVDETTTISTTSATAVDVDSTNLKITGTVPSSGEMKVVLRGTPHCGNGGYHYWHLRDASAEVAGTKRFAVFSSGLASGYQMIEYELTGLTP